MDDSTASLCRIIRGRARRLGLQSRLSRPYEETWSWVTALYRNIIVAPSAAGSGILSDRHPRRDAPVATIPSVNLGDVYFRALKIAPLLAIAGVLSATGACVCENMLLEHTLQTAMKERAAHEDPWLRDRCKDPRSEDVRAATSDFDRPSDGIEV